MVNKKPALRMESGFCVCGAYSGLMSIMCALLFSGSRDVAVFLFRFLLLFLLPLDGQDAVLLGNLNILFVYAWQFHNRTIHLGHLKPRSESGGWS